MARRANIAFLFALVLASNPLGPALAGERPLTGSWVELKSKNDPCQCCSLRLVQYGTFLFLLNERGGALLETGIVAGRTATGQGRWRSPDGLENFDAEVAADFDGRRLSMWIFHAAVGESDEPQIYVFRRFEKAAIWPRL